MEKKKRLLGLRLISLRTKDLIERGLLGFSILLIFSSLIMFFIKYVTSIDIYLNPIYILIVGIIILIVGIPINNLIYRL